MSEVKVYYIHTEALFEATNKGSSGVVLKSDYETLMKWNNRNVELVTQQDWTIKNQAVQISELVQVNLKLVEQRNSWVEIAYRDDKQASIKIKELDKELEIK